jgi:hypothetical protein
LLFLFLFRCLTDLYNLKRDRTYTAFTRTCRQVLREVRQSMPASQSLPALETSEPGPIKSRKWLAISVQRHQLNSKLPPDELRLFRCRVPSVRLRLVRGRCSARRMLVEVGSSSQELRTCCYSHASWHAITERLWSAMTGGIPSGEHRSLPGSGVPLLHGRRTPCAQQV